MAAKGHTNLHLLVLGSVSQGVAHLASRPLLIARPGAEKVRTVLVAYHGSTNARKALRFLNRLAMPAEARIVLVNVMETFKLPERTPPAYREEAIQDAREINERRQHEAARSLEGIVNELEAQGRALLDEFRRRPEPAALRTFVHSPPHAAPLAD